MGPPEGFFRVASLAELREQGFRLVSLQGQTVVLFYHDGEVHAVDNRCPHMGFPLHRGTLRGGILTCHWHHARFDLASGGTFDPWADDVRAYSVRVVEGEVWVDPSPPQGDPAARWKARLREGLEQEIGLVLAKSVIGLLSAGVDFREALRIGAEFGSLYTPEGFGPGLTILTAMANLLPYLRPEDRARALFHGLVHVAREASGMAPRFPLKPLPSSSLDEGTLKRWFREFVQVRDAQGAERCLLTAIESGFPPRQISDMAFSAATDHIFLDGGHVLDFANKAFELLDHIGWEKAGLLLPGLAPRLAAARRSEESPAWRHPVDLADLLRETYEEIPSCWEAQKGGWEAKEELIDTLLGDDPAQTVQALKEALRAGAPPETLAGEVAYAAALRIARFHTSNEYGDWGTVLHTFTYANALQRAMERAPSPELLRGVFDGAMSIYLDRFLNMPPAPLPEGGSLSRGGGEGAGDELTELLGAFDVRQQVAPAGALAARHLRGGGDPDALLATLGQALLREDSEFHTIQMVEAGFRQHADRRGTGPGGHILVAVARYLAAHTPTPRALEQTFQIAQRLHRGEVLYEEA